MQAHGFGLFVKGTMFGVSLTGTMCEVITAVLIREEASTVLGDSPQGCSSSG